VTRNPVVQAHLVRAADQRFADQEESGGTIEAGLASAYNSVRFLSLCIGKPSTDQVESEG